VSERPEVDAPEPEIFRLPVRIRHAEVLHFLGYPEDSHPPARVEEHIRELLQAARPLVDARGAYRHVALDAARDLGLEPIPASGLVVGMVTAGDGIEKRVTELIQNGESLAALLLDAMGSAAAEEAADLLGSRIVGVEPDHPGEATAISCRISPGYGQWPLSAQHQLFQRLPHRELGMQLLPSLLMVPRKSISFAMWMGADARPLAGLSGCARCQLERCQYRREEKGSDG
jgi:hypothetical protein